MTETNQVRPYVFLEINKAIKLFAQAFSIKGEFKDIEYLKEGVWHSYSFSGEIHQISLITQEGYILFQYKEKGW